mmetsp:Transcript_46632/g.120284  ORF Transcript_46632/g.120284 Transcript_46632/m.120284 type:complete len:438 (-) Transcript_46632:92-1405(-)
MNPGMRTGTMASFMLSLLVLRFGAGQHIAGDPFSVLEYGATGDGSTDDTVSVQKTIDACAAAGGGVVEFPAGSFLISGSLQFPDSPPILTRGYGSVSVILWSFDGDLFTWTCPSYSVQVVSLAVGSVTVQKSPSSFALRVGTQPGCGAQKSLFREVSLYGAGAIPGTSTQTLLAGSGFDLGSVSDTTTIQDCLLWFVRGTGIRIGRGSEVRILGGRIIGPLPGDASRVSMYNDSIGVHVTGNNGGVHISNTDLISHGIGMLLDSSNGQGSNREIFLSQATLDSNGVGLQIEDNSYVSINGIWSASADVAQVWMRSSAANALLVVNGGTIFNGGVYGGGDPYTCNFEGSACNGIVIDAGTFVLTGVAIRNNKGVGVLVNSGAVSNYQITGCNVFGNSKAVSLQGKGYSCTSNIFHGNLDTGNFGDKEGGAIVSNNVLN